MLQCDLSLLCECGLYSLSSAQNPKYLVQSCRLRKLKIFNKKNWYHFMETAEPCLCCNLDQVCSNKVLTWRQFLGGGLCGSVYQFVSGSVCEIDQMRRV
jgi:hypothetical protein